MFAESEKVRDPVCLMEVDPDQHAIEYEGMHFAFCSRQCQERFMANPHAYIGVPGAKAPKQQGRQIVKRRRLRLAEPLPEPMEREITDRLTAMMGMKTVWFRQCAVSITYDLLQVTMSQIEAVLQDAGARLSQAWVQKARRACIHYFEETEAENLAVHPRHGGHGHGGAHHHH